MDNANARATTGIANSSSANFNKTSGTNKSNASRTNFQIFMDELLDNLKNVNKRCTYFNYIFHYSNNNIHVLILGRYKCSSNL